MIGSEEPLRVPERNDGDGVARQEMSPPQLQESPEVARPKTAGRRVSTAGPSLRLSQCVPSFPLGPRQRLPLPERRKQMVALEEAVVARGTDENFTGLQRFEKISHRVHTSNRLRQSSKDPGRRKHSSRFTIRLLKKFRKIGKMLGNSSSMEN